MKNKILFISLLFCFAACKINSSFKNPEKYIVCTTTMIGDAVKILVGDKVEVKTLMGDGIDPHSYEPKPSDVHALGEAGVIVYNGLHLEGKMADLFRRIKKERITIAFSDGINEERLIAISNEHHDPHIWFDPIIWLNGIEHCKTELQKAYPDLKEFIEVNFLAYKKEVLVLFDKLKAEVLAVDTQKRVLITSHDAFHYFGRAFSVKVKALQGVSTVTEPGLSEVSDLVKYIVSHKIPAVFVESSVSKKSIESVIEACKSSGHELKIGGMLYSDALGPKKSSSGTYVGMLTSNVRTIIRGLKD